MSEPRVLRFSNGDRKYPAHVELEKQGWIRGDYPNRRCKYCGRIGEWWGRAPIGSGGWTLFNPHSTTKHSCWNTSADKKHVSEDRAGNP